MATPAAQPTFSVGEILRKSCGKLLPKDMSSGRNPTKKNWTAGWRSSTIRGLISETCRFDRGDARHAELSESSPFGLNSPLQG